MRIALFSATLLVSSLATAATAIDGLYSSLYGGYSYLPDNIRQFHRGVFFDNVSYHNGYNAGLRFGFQSHPLRYEGELTFINAKANTFRLRQFFNQPFPNRYVSGQAYAAFAMANVYYDFFEIIPCISPFLGVGLGYGWIETTVNIKNYYFLNYSFLYSSSEYRFRGADSAFAYQGTAGLTFNFSENYALNVAYRYIGTTKINQLGKNFQTNLASVGVVYRFDEYKYK